MPAWLSTASKKIGSAAGLAVSAVDARDCVLGFGLALLGVGLGLVSIPVALIVPGAVLVYVAIFGVRDRGGEGD